MTMKISWTNTDVIPMKMGISWTITHLPHVNGVFFTFNSDLIALKEH